MAGTQEVSTPFALAREWLAQYRQELANGPERARAVLESARDEAENALPGSDTHRAYTLLLEMLRLADEDLDPETED